MMTAERATITHREQMTPQHVLLRLHAPRIAATAAPGQFVHLRVTESWDPLLRRPFSLMLADRETGLVELLVQVVGRGSEAVAAAVEGQSFDLLGPLGTGFPSPPAGARVYLVGGGVGVAPLVALAEELGRSPQEYEVVGLLGARTDQLLCGWMELSSRCGQFVAVTEDGSLGPPRLVTGELERQLAEADEARVVYACGPLGMLAGVAEICAARQIPCWVSLERWMGCGVGACLGCVVPSALPEGPRYVRVCHEGPVFAAEALDWEAMPR